MKKIKNTIKRPLRHYHRMNPHEQEGIFTAVVLLAIATAMGITAPREPKFLIVIATAIISAIAMIISAISTYKQRREDTAMYYEEGKRKGMINFEHTIEKYKHIKTK